jgi:site-specific DNA-methyltransferase (adenine-specific)
MAAVDLLPIYEAEGLQAMGHGGAKAAPAQPANEKGLADLPHLSRDKAAAALGVSGRGVGQAKRVTQQAPDLADQVRAGTLALDAAERQLKRRKVQASEQEARAITMVDVPADAQGKNWKLFAGDFRDRLNELPDGSVDLICTDPPYPREFLHLWEDLAKHAARVLKPQGVLVAMSGKIQLPQAMALLGAHLQYGWIYCQPTPGAVSRILARQTLQAWKPWLAYSNGQWPSGSVDWHEDMLEPSHRSKSVFRWEQDGDPAEYLIEVLSPPGGTVLDPFAGSGAFMASAIARGRIALGVEADLDRFAAAAERLGGLT